MRRISDRSTNYFDGAVANSLITIKEAHLELRLLTGAPPTAALLASQIRLCDLLLDEISGIHASLAENLQRARVGLQAPSPGLEYLSEPN